MACDRVRVCKYYEAEGKCLKGRDGTFWKYCQKCGKYDPVKGAKAARTDTRRQRIERANRKECD